MSFIFSSESVSEGHPDKVCDQISDAILDACLEQDAESRVACETMCTANRVVMSGEITTKSEINTEEIARKTVRDIGYTFPELGFEADSFQFESFLHKQSPNISQGVDETNGHEQGAGDQGMMFGYAAGSEETEYMPEPIYYSHKIMQLASDFRKQNYWGRKHLRPDAKCQLSFEYSDDSRSLPILRTAVVSQQHTEDTIIEALKTAFQDIIFSSIPIKLGKYKMHLNPTGKFVLGGPAWDTGLTGRKIVVDTYGGMGKVGGGAFSGKDPSKVDRSAAYMCRHVAKHLVKTGLCKKCELQVAYAIGIAEPVSIYVNHFGTGEKGIEDYVKEKFDFRPKAIIERLGLKRPVGWSYEQTAKNGHFGHPEFPWERDAE